MLFIEIFMCGLTTVLFDECLITPPCTTDFHCESVGKILRKSNGFAVGDVKVSLNKSLFSIR